MKIHVCGQRGVWSTVDVPEGEVLDLRETLRDLEDNTQAIRIQVGGDCPSNATAEEANAEEAPESEGDAQKSKRKSKSTA